MFSLIRYITIPALATLSVAGTLVGAQEKTDFLSSLATSKTDAGQIAKLLLAADSTVFPEAKLNSEAHAYSTQWMQTILREKEFTRATKGSWTAYRSADGVSKLFNKSWRSSLGTATWSDNGVLAVLRIQFDERYSLKSKAVAQELADQCLGTYLNLPELSAEEVKSFIKPSSEYDGKPVYSGNVFRGVKTEPIDLGNGRIGRKGTHPLQWHHMIFVVVNESEVIFRINFFEANQETLSRISDPTTRFFSPSR